MFSNIHSLYTSKYEVHIFKKESHHFSNFDGFCFHQVNKSPWKTPLQNTYSHTHMYVELLRSFRFCGLLRAVSKSTPVPLS